jgi:double-stranded uracil-DNA glycosylase
LGALTGLPPIIDAQARILILGSFPSEASLAAGQYYAHRQNQFWRILSAVLGQPLSEMDYPARQTAVMAAGLAIWDVYGRCERQGSLDTAIRNGRQNDFGKLKALAPRLAKVCFNGQTAGKFEKAFAALGYETVILPSTSPANAGWSFERKLVVWRVALVG